MPRATVTQAVIVRTVQAVERAGLRICRVEVRPDGTIIVHSVDGGADHAMLAASAEANEWDTLLVPEASQ